MPSPHVRRRCAALLLSLLALGATGDDASARLGTKEWGVAKSEFEKLFAAPGGAEAKIAVLRTIAGDGTSRAWKLLAEGFAREVGFRQESDTAYTAAASVHGDILLRSIKGYTVDAETRAKALQAQMAALEAQGRETRQVLAAFVGILAAAPARARVPVLRLAKPKAPWAVRAVAARVAGASLSDKASLKHIKKLLRSEPDRRVRLAALAAMAGPAQQPEGARELVAARLGDPDAGVVRAAADVVRAHPFAAAGAPLQAASEGASPYMLARLAPAIEALLADADAGPASGTLRAWWAERKPTPTKARVATMPLVSDGVLFVLDVSNGMKPATKPGSWKREAAQGAAKVPPAAELDIEGTLLDRARHELQLAIRRLAPGTRFNVLAFNHGASLWERSMQPVTSETRDGVKRWMRALTPSGSAYVAGALRLAFRLAGTFTDVAEAGVPPIDTLVVLSVGKPTDNTFPVHKLMAAEDVLGRVRYWNASHGIVIHTAAFGESAFLKELAAQNGGTHVHR